MKRTKHPYNPKNGFSLIEAAIVLGIVGIVIGSIWVAAASVQRQHKLKRAQEHLIQISTNLRHLYGGRPGPVLNSTDSAYLASRMKAAGVVPASMPSVGNVVYNDFGGVLSLDFDGGFGVPIGNPSDSFQIGYFGVTKDICAELLSRTTPRYRDMKLAYAWVGRGQYNVTSGEPAGKGGTYQAYTALPISLSNANTYCSGIVGTNGYVGWSFNF